MEVASVNDCYLENIQMQGTKVPKKLNLTDFVSM